MTTAGTILTSSSRIWRRGSESEKYYGEDDLKVSVLVSAPNQVKGLFLIKGWSRKSSISAGCSFRYRVLAALTAEAYPLLQLHGDKGGGRQGDDAEP